jgi:hypothetical protein
VEGSARTCVAASQSRRVEPHFCPLEGSAIDARLNRHTIRRGVSLPVQSDMR